MHKSQMTFECNTEGFYNRTKKGGGKTGVQACPNNLKEVSIIFTLRLVV